MQKRRGFKRDPEESEEPEQERRLKKRLGRRKENRESAMSRRLIKQCFQKRVVSCARCYLQLR